MLAVFFLVLTGQTRAQDFDRYEVLRCSGDIPQELLTRSSEKYAADKAEIGNLGDKKEQASRDQFLLQSNFVLDELLLSGKVLFNDPIGEYLNRVKDYLLRDDPKNQEKIKVYVVRSPMVNAFCTNNGAVLFHLGLLSKLETEAQLAYVLSHEIQHYLYQHPIDRYVVDQKMKDQKGIFGMRDYEAYLTEKSRYSQDQELEADLQGLELFIRSAYSTRNLDKIFDVLRYSYLPYQQMEWRPEEFSVGSFQVPELFSLDSVSSISAEEDYDDSQMSHPNIARRRQAFNERMESVRDTDGPEFIFGEENFLHTRKIARFEMAHHFLTGHQYEKAIYHCLLLLQEHPNSLFLKKTIAQALYALVKYKNADSLYEVHPDYEDIEGTSQRLYFMTETMSDPELTAVAVNYCWRLSQQYPEETYLRTISEDLVEEFHVVGEEWVEDMVVDASGKTYKSDTLATTEPEPEDKLRPELEDAPEPEELEFAETEEVEDDTTESQSAIDRKLEALEDHRASKDYFLRTAFVDLFQDTSFVNTWEQARETADEPDMTWEEFMADFNLEINAEEPEQLGLEKVVFLNPIYKKVDERTDVAEEYIASEVAREEFYGLMKEMGSRVGLKTQILSYSSLNREDVETFNDQVLLKSWISEQMGHSSAGDLINIHQEEVLALVEKYGTPYFAMNGGIFYTSIRSAAEKLMLCYSCVAVVTIPFALYAIFTPKHGIMYFNWVWNIETGEVAMRETRFIKMKENQTLLKSALYYSFLQMKSQP